ncbi:hypothetical protein GQ43DRAFT_316164 [Delitschia confertaspora ATCC 74209]|uniref:Uncharacterized protein n=1 Tax=Delitschia confertaspora ATCC 74209 TaxID=1513339 RepID=A0A9P4JS75_9PLEO|nr:hypothetical protein GQ43DRAFT_316164 [Delitschia confertaspora ATCC 74209]
MVHSGFSQHGVWEFPSNVFLHFNNLHSGIAIHGFYGFGVSPTKVHPSSFLLFTPPPSFGYFFYNQRGVHHREQNQHQKFKIPGSLILGEGFETHSSFSFIFANHNQRRIYPFVPGKKKCISKPTYTSNEQNSSPSTDLTVGVHSVSATYYIYSVLSTYLPT